MSRRSDAEYLLSATPSDGSAIGNKTLISNLGWAPNKYWRVRDELLAAGKLERGKGKGGSVRRPTASTQPPEVMPRNPTEDALYEPLIAVLRNEWVREMGIDPSQIHLEITAKQGKRPTGGTWTRPDITAVSVRTFQHLPNKYVDVWTFEVKPLAALDVTAIFEAAAHASRATRSYALLQVPLEADDREKELIDRCEKEATRLRVGLITFFKENDFSTWETRVEAPRLDTAPEALEEFIGHLSDEAKKKLGQWK